MMRRRFLNVFLAAFLATPFVTAQERVAPPEWQYPPPWRYMMEEPAPPVPLLIGAEYPRGLQLRFDSIVQAGLACGAFPGAQVAVGDRTGVRFSRAYGFLDYTSGQPALTDDIYDVASCSKVFSTTFVIMRLCDEEILAPEQTLAELLPRFAGTAAATVTVEELLTHTSGFRQQTFYRQLVATPDGAPLLSGKQSAAYPHHVDRNLYMAADVSFDTLFLATFPRVGWRRMGDRLYVNPAVDTMIENRIADSFNPAQRGKYTYIDSNFFLLKQIVERATGRTLQALSAELYAELGCLNTGYRPLEWAARERIAPTEEDYLMRRGLIRGEVHDELAALSNGVGGNAGLFSTAEDMARFCVMLLNDGVYDGRRILSPEVVRRFTASPLAGQGIYRGLGFDRRGPKSDLGGDSFGHTGYTGAIFWADRDRGCFLLFLSNRVHPTRTNNKLSSTELRVKLWKAITAHYGL